jgi:predicted metal-dependent hydrolase
MSMSTVFHTQWKFLAKDDWTTQVQKDLVDFEIHMSLGKIKKKSPDSFKRLVKRKTKEYTLNYLLGLKEKHSKMDNLNYIELKLQNYLKDDKIPV